MLNYKRMCLHQIDVSYDKFEASVSRVCLGIYHPRFSSMYENNLIFFSFSFFRQGTILSQTTSPFPTIHFISNQNRKINETGK